MHAAGKGKGAPPPPKGLGKGAPPPPKAGGHGMGKAPPIMPDGKTQPPLMGPKLRPLFWTALKQAPLDSVWTDLVAPAPFDAALLERQFALTDTRTPAFARGGGGAGSRSASEEPRKRVRVLDDRASQLLAIAFNRLPPPERVADMLTTLEDFPDGLAEEAEAVLALRNAMIEQRDAVEQIRLMAVSPETIAQLDMPERFLLRVSAVSLFDVKLACGALILGCAKEIAELRTNGEKVAVCCQEFRESGLLRKCVSTALAVGNYLNRGTARQNVRGLVLPESLLKLNELRGNSSFDSASDGPDRDTAANSVLDVVAQAIMNEEGIRINTVVAEAEELLRKAKAASSVSLEETEACCRQVSSEATRANGSLVGAPSSTSMTRLVLRVVKICEEAASAVDVVQKAKEELDRTQTWSCCKGKVKSNDWFVNWIQFLEILPGALARAGEARTRRLAQEQTLREEAARCLHPQRVPIRDVTNQVATSNITHRRKVILDDDARCENIDWTKLSQQRAFRQDDSHDPIKPRAVLTEGATFTPKENA